MAFDLYRRTSSGLPARGGDNNAPPPAPPLPPQRPAEPQAPRATFLNRIIGGTRRAAPQAETSHELRSQLLYSQRYGSTSRTTRHKTGLRIRALDINQARTHAVLAGGKILKTIRIDGSSCVEDFNLRNATLSYAWEGEGGSEQRPGRSPEDASAVQQQTFDIEDVAWSSGQYASYIATAAANGRIMLYDLERPAVQVCALQEHTRQVHKVDFSPLEGRFLLSGSQDGTVRLWDLRHAPDKSTIFQGRADGVRHTKWSPTSTWYFALATDSGAVQRWDIRQTRSPVLKIAAHIGTCNSIDWHPDGKHLVSAGKDQIVKVWNISSERRPRRAAFQFVAPKEIQNVRWRPPCYVSQSQDSLLKQCTQLATSYRRYPVVHVWDLRRPHLPFKEVYQEVNSGTTDMLWQSKDLLWTVGAEGEFSQTDIPFAPKTISKRPAQVMSQSPLGEMSFVSQLHHPHEAQRPQTLGQDDFAMEDAPPRASASPSKLSKSLQGDDSFEENFLSTSYTRRHSRTPSVKSTRSYGSTPPSAEDFARPVVFLDESMRAHQGLQPHQTSLVGPAPGMRAPKVFAHLARDLCSFDPLHLSDAEKASRFAEICEGRAVLLHKLGRHRDAQVWRILGMKICRVLQARARRREKSSQGGSEGSLSLADSQPVFPRPAPAFAASARRLISRGSSTTRSQSQRGVDSTSNVPTPLAKPVRRVGVDKDEQHSDIEDAVQLPDSLVSGRFHGTTDEPMAEPVAEQGPEEPYDGTGAMLRPSGSAEERRRDMLSSYRGQPRIPLDLAEPFVPMGPHDIPPRLDRHDSGDSFLMFSTSSESQRKFSGRASMASSLSFTGSHPMWQGRANGHGRQRGQSVASDVIVEDVVDDGSPGASYESSQLSTDSPELRHGEDELAGQFSGSFRGEQRAVEPPRPGTSHKDYPKPTRPTTGGDTVSMQVTTESLTTIEEPLRDSQHSELGSLATSDILISGMHLGLDEDTWEVVDLFGQLLEGYCAAGDAQLAAHLYAVCAAVLIPGATTTAAAAQHDGDLVLHHPVLSNAYHHLTDAVGFAASTAKDIVLSTHLVLEELGIASGAVEALLAAYHAQLVAHRLYTPAAQLRQLAYPSFPAVYEAALAGTDTGMLCTKCKSPINNAADKTRCEICKTKQGDCPVCQLPESPYALPPRRFTRPPRRSSQAQTTTTTPTVPLRLAPGSKTRLWSACALCNHAAHTACAYAWYADAVGGGACPMAGCLCDCASGPYRDARLARARLEAETQAQVKWRPGSGVSISVTSPGDGGGGGTAMLRTTTPGVQKDEWAVGQSRAVRSVRGELRDGAYSDGEAERRTDKARRRRDRSGAAAAGGTAAAAGGRGSGSGGGRRVRLVEPES